MNTQVLDQRILGVISIGKLPTPPNRYKYSERWYQNQADVGSTRPSTLSTTRPIRPPSTSTLSPAASGEAQTVHPRPVPQVPNRRPTDKHNIEPATVRESETEFSGTSEHVRVCCVNMTVLKVWAMCGVGGKDLACDLVRAFTPLPTKRWTPR